MQSKRVKAGTGNRFVAALLAAAMVGYWVPADVQGADAPARLAEIQGSILAADGLTAIQDVSVKAANLQTRRVYTSDATTEEGLYKLSGLPEGTYDLAVDTGDGLYVADVLIEAESAKPALVSLALTPLSPAEGDEEQPVDEEDAEAADDEEGEQTEPAEEPEPEQKKKKKKGPGFWRSPTGAAITIVVGAGLVGAAANSIADDTTTESLTPSN